MQRIPTFILTACLITGAQALTTGSLRAQAVSPAGRAGLEGSSSTSYPLGRHDARVQQLHADLPSTTSTIMGHAYRRDAVSLRGQVDAFTADLEITLSMSPRTPGTASRTFADNVGSGSAIVVLPRTTVSFPVTQRPGTAPAPTFDLVIPYQLPFALSGAPGVLCVDTVVFGNQTTGGSNRNFTAYQDAHTFASGGRSEQPGFRFGQGCIATGATAAAYANLSLWHMGGYLELEIAARRGIRDSGSGSAWPFLALGTAAANVPWPNQPTCTLLTSTELWLPLSHANSATGTYDGTLGPLPVLVPGLQLFAQVGSVELRNGDLVLSDASELTVPLPAPASLPAVRIAHGSDRSSPTGTVSSTVAVTRFF